MNLRTVKAALVGTVFAVASFGSAAQAATAPGTATAEILADVAVAQTTALDFGTIAVGPTGNSVTIANSGGTVQSCTGSCTGGARGAFSITGETGMDVDIAVDASVLLQKTGFAVGHVYTADQQMTATLNTDISTLTLDGTDAFAVGGVLGVAATQEAGSYSGTYTVTVTYQ